MTESPVEAKGYIHSGAVSSSDPDGSSLTDIYGQGSNKPYDAQRYMDKLSAEQRVTIVNMSPRDMTIEPRQPPLSYFFPIAKTRPKFWLGTVDVTNETHLRCSFAEWAKRPTFGVDYLQFTIE